MSYSVDGEDELHVSYPSKDIVCKDCAFRDDGTIYTNDYTKGSCQKFPYPDMKPSSVLFKNAMCPCYKKE